MLLLFCSRNCWETDPDRSVPLASSKTTYVAFPLNCSWSRYTYWTTLDPQRMQSPLKKRGMPHCLLKSHASEVTVWAHKAFSYTLFNKGCRCRCHRRLAHNRTSESSPSHLLATLAYLVSAHPLQEFLMLAV